MVKKTQNKLLFGILIVLAVLAVAFAVFQVNLGSNLDIKKT